MIIHLTFTLAMLIELGRMHKAFKPGSIIAFMTDMQDFSSGKQYTNINFHTQVTPPPRDDAQSIRH